MSKIAKVIIIIGMVLILGFIYSIMPAYIQQIINSSIAFILTFGFIIAFIISIFYLVIKTVLNNQSNAKQHSTTRKPQQVK